MKHTRTRLTALLLTVAMMLALAVPAMAAEENWWEQYVTTPMADWSIEGVADGHVTSHGRYVLVTSDTHRYTYLAENLLEQANKVINADGEEGNVGLMCFGGDFANEKVLYDDNMSIVKAALKTSEGTVATYTKGNHEGNVTDAEFLEKTGMSRIGETAVNFEGYYHFFNFGALNGTQQFTDDDIVQLKAYLEKEEVSGDGKPIIIVSHYPLHYYNDRRTSAQAAQVLEVLNDYPQVIFLWGHNHTEADPNYGMIRVPGDVIQTTSSVDSTREIKFTYACLGALRDGINEANGLLMRMNDDGTTTFRYIGLHANGTEETWTDAQGNENPVRVPSNEEISSDNTYVTPTEDTYKTISLANVQIARPLVDKTPAETASVFSPRFTSGAITWTAYGAAVTGSFDFDTTYTATFTLTAEDGYRFADNAVVSVNKEYVGPAPGQENHVAEKVDVSADGSTATVTYTFDKTTAKSEKAAEVADLKEGSQYVMAAIGENMAASYLYNPADHGEESKPSYTAAPADVVVRDEKLVSVTTPSMVFTAQKDADGFLLWSDASLKAEEGATTLNFLSMSTKGGDLGLEASESAGLSIYTDWNSEDGIPYLDIDGVKEYVAYQNGAFCYVTDPEDSNVRLFEVGTNNEKTIYNVTATVETPAPGAKSSEAVTVNPGCTVESVKWDANAFTYDTSYTVTLTLKAAEGYTVSDALTARVNGGNATITSEDGKLTVTYTFPATTSAPGLKIGLQGKAAEGLENGKQYVITVNNQALTAAAAQGIYLAAASTEDGMTSDMVFTAAGNDTDGYTLKNDDQYLAGRPVDDSPDQWGFMLTNDASSGLLFTYEDGKLKVVSSGTYGAMGPPPGAKDSYLYLNGDHFNFGSLQSSDVTIQALVSPFTDVSEDRWSYEYIYESAATGTMLGVTQTTFEPRSTMTRAMAVTVLYRMDGAPEVSGKADYTDVRQNAFYTQALIWGTENGIVNGYQNGTYRPNDPVSRQQFATMIQRYLDYKDITPEGENSVAFTDADSIADYAKEGVELCVKAGIITGYKDGSFKPTAKITREEAAAMLVRLLKLA